MEGRRLIEGRWVRWDAQRARAAYAHGWWVRQTLGEDLKRAAEQTPDRVLLVDGDVSLDCRTLYEQAVTLAQAMRARARPGSVVSFILPNWHEAASIYLATHLAGMIVNPIVPSMRDRELLFLLEDVQSRLIFVPHQFRDYDYGQMMARIAPRLSSPPAVFTVRGEAADHMPYASLFAEGAQCNLPLPDVDPDGVRLVLYTSGTTGTPKGVLHSQNSIHALVRQIGRYWSVNEGDRFLVPSPISHIGGSIYAFECPLLLGTTAVLLDRWDARVAVDIVTRQRCTHLAGATPFLAQLLEAAQQANTRLNGLKVFVCGGASVPPSLIRAAAAHFDQTIVTRVYGSTEVPVTTVGVPDRQNVAHAAETDGRVAVAEVKLIDASGRRADEGEIRARGPQMLVGYLHAEDETSVFDEEGYYRTGDLGRWAEDDFLIVSGRAKDIIIRNGENISPKEVEDYLREHPNIDDVAIVGLPDARTGERACAAIVPKDLPIPDVADLRAFLKALGVASFKIPEQVFAMESLPKNDAGKTLKHEIRALLLHQNQPS
ncbi:MAG TPA: AMP-binding protein [Polyangiaceae bacterium]|nr:AMP-binding protein [Polyangiaceae bacterium]